MTAGTFPNRYPVWTGMRCPNQPLPPQAPPPPPSPPLAPIHIPEEGVAILNGSARYDPRVSQFGLLACLWPGDEEVRNTPNLRSTSPAPPQHLRSTSPAPPQHLP